MAGRGKPKKLNTEQLWDYALALLGRRAQSAAELRRKLFNRADSPQSLSNVMSKLADYQMADDTKFSEAFASSRLQNKGLGRVRALGPEAGVERSWNSGVAEAVTGGLAADLPSGGEAVQQLADGGSRGHQAIVSIDFDLNCQSVSRLSACVYSTQS